MDEFMQICWKKAPSLPNHSTALCCLKKASFHGLLWSVEQNKISRTQWFKSYQFLSTIMCVRRFERFWAKRLQNKSRTCLAINFPEDSVCHTLSYIRIYCLHSNCFNLGQLVMLAKIQAGSCDCDQDAP